ncbi:MAG: serine/threonine-protein kinase [Isosphaeraceae bacterium]
MNSEREPAAAAAGPDALSLVDLIDRACDAFEAEWRAGSSPRIEEFLAAAPARAREGLFRELLLLELDLVRRAGGTPDPEDYLRRFPDEAEAVTSACREAAGQAANAGTVVHDSRPGVPREWPRPELPGYILLDELGRGGMGVVYRARDVRLNRVVALKMVVSGPYAHPEQIARLQAEAETIARLQHPNVVRIHSVGEHDGLPYLDMEYVDGGSLASRLDGTPWPPRAAASLVESLARGVEAVHRLGVVHRDLKPGNVLIAADGVPRIADFGLARSLVDDSGLTRTDAVIGSPSYMAPEQAEGHARAAGPPADVYALGAVLYELLTGRPPFRAATMLETLEQVRTAEPVAPARLVPTVPRDLETVALKCLEKTQARRYPSAEALADDLRRCLDHRPVLARRTGPVGRFARWCRRSPWVAGLTAAVFLLLLAVAAVSTTAAFRVAAAAAQERRTLYFARMNLVQQAWEDADTRRMRDLLAPYAKGADDLRGFEWFYWWRLANRPAASLTGHRRPVVAAAFTPDGRTLFTADAQSVRLWDVSARRPLASWAVPGGGVLALAVSPDGATVAAGGYGGRVFLWDRATGARKEALRDGPETVCALGFLDAHTLISAHAPNTDRVWDVRSGKHLRTVRGSSPPRGRVDDAHPPAMAVSADGRNMAVAGFDGLVIFRGTEAKPPAVPTALALADVLSKRLGRPVLSKEPPPAEVPLNVGDRTARALAFSPDGSVLAVSGEDAAITLWDVSARRVRRVLRREQNGTVWSLAFAPDGATLVAASLDNTVTLWDVATGRLALTLKGHGGPVMAVAVAPDGHTVASGGWDHVVTLWDASRGEPDAPLSASDAGLDAVAFSSDGRTLATGGRDGRIVLRDAETGRERGRIEPRSAANPDGHPTHVRALAFTPDGKSLVSAGWNTAACVWDVERRSLRFRLRAGPDDDRGSTAVAVAPDGRTAAVGGFNGRVTLWDLATARPRPSGTLAEARASDLAFSPDGKTLAAAVGAETVQLHDPEGRRASAVLTAPGVRITSLAFAPGSRTLAAGCEDGALVLWDVASRRAPLIHRAHTNELTALSFAPDGKTLATAGRDKTVRLWDPSAGELKSTLKGHTENVMGVAFRPDGRALASVGLDATARIWLAAPR